MKYKIFISLLLLFTHSQLNAQVRKTYKVNPGEKVMKALPNEALYLYPHFKIGTVNFRNKNVGTAKLNYNRLLDEIQFIDNKDDTLSLGDEVTVSSIVIEKDTFYYYEGYVKIISTQSKVKFASKKILALSNKQKIGGMGELSSASIATYDKMSSPEGIRDLVPKEILTFSEYSNYFIGDAYNRFKPLNRKNLLNMYAKHQLNIEIYLREKAVNFLKEDDVVKLIGFLGTL